MMIFRYRRALTLVLFAAFAGTAANPPRGQAATNPEPGWIYRDIRTGTEVAVEQLGTYLTENLAVGSVGAADTGNREIRPPSWDFALHVDLVSRVHGVIASYVSQAVAVSPGHDYRVASWFPKPRDLNQALAAPLKPAEFVIFRIGQKTVVKGDRLHTVPRECGSAEYALLVSMSRPGQGPPDSGGTGKTMAVCLEH